MKPSLIDMELSDPGIALLTMRDPGRKNALSLEMVHELEEHLNVVGRRNDVKTVVLAGLEDYFSTGASREVLEQLASGQAAPRDLLLPRVLFDIPVPIIAAMEGHAIGGGLALGICADLSVAARESRYCASFMNFGFTPGLGLTELLEHFFGPALSHEMLLTGQAFRGKHFEGRMGYNYVLPKNQVLKKALDLAGLLAEKPRVSLVSLKLSLSSRKRELFEAARTRECLMHQITFPQPEVERLIRELLE
jgi:polyketide biosynthesis enoyl-CoA hydratase PksI